MEKKKEIAVIGCGTWGRNIVRNFYNLEALNCVCDLNDDNLKATQELYPDLKCTKNIDEILNDPDIKGVCVVTPSHTHYNMVQKCLNAGKNVYVEKPISTKAQEALDLENLAHSKDLILMVGHLLLYHPAVNRLKMLVEEGALGKIKYVQSDRLNINYHKNDRSVMWDLAPHDLSMASYVIGSDPKALISAVGCDSEIENIFDITHLTIEFENGAIGQLSDSWIHPEKRVTLLVRGEKATAILDDTLPTGKIKLYDNKVPAQKHVDVVDYLEIEPLKLECQHFLDCIHRKRTPRSDGRNGLMTAQVLEEAEKVLLGSKLDALDKVTFASYRMSK